MRPTASMLLFAVLPLAGVPISDTAHAQSQAQTAVTNSTPLNLKKCRHTAGKEQEDYGDWRCAGFQGIAVYVAAGDQRTYVSYGRNAKMEPAAKETLAAFNGEGNRIEWRSDRGADGKLTPFATIMRFNTTVTDANDKRVTGAMLVVTRLPPGAVCHVGYVDARANPDATLLVQKIADENARAFKCGSDTPVILGNRGPGFSGPYGK